MPAMVTTRRVNMLLLLVTMLAMNSTHTQSGEPTDLLDGLSPDTRPLSRQIRGGRNTIFFRWEYTKGGSMGHGGNVFFLDQARGALAWTLEIWRNW
jgi:hypothetical protein